MTTTMDVRLTGVSSLMLSRYSGEKVERNLAPEKEVLDRIYLTKQGRPYVPGEHLKAAIQSVASMIKLEGKGNLTFTRLVPGGVLVSPINPIEPAEYEIDIRPVTVGGATIKRVRPRWDEWTLDVKLTLIDPDVTPKVIKQLLALAGLRAGIGDARRLGCGRFNAEVLKVTEQ